MLATRGLIVLMLVAAFGLNACVAPPPRERVVYRDQGPRDQGAQSYDQQDAPQGYEQRPSGRYCHA